MSSFLFISLVVCVIGNWQLKQKIKGVGIIRVFSNLKRIIHFWEIWWNFGRSFRFQFTRCLFRSFFRFDEKMFMVFTFLYIGMSYRTYLLEYREHFLTAIAILSQWKCSLRKWFLLGRISHPLRPKIES